MSAPHTSYNDCSDLYGFYAWSGSLKGIQYGPGCLETALPKFLDLLGAKKALIVTGRTLYEKTDVVQQVEAVLKKCDAYGGVFYKIGEHAPIAGIRKGQQAFKDGGADVIVSVGGGSPTDAAKAILYHLHKDDGGAILKQIAIPTTLSAAEYTPGTGLTSEEGHKVIVASPELAPAAIILDAKLTLHTPERLWLSSGMRAVDHAVETLYRQLAPPPVKHLSYAALADLFVNLPLSKAHPEDVNVRQKLQIASWMSLWPMKFESPSAFGLSHSLGHKLGATYGIPHGITSCLTLAPVVALKAETASPEDKEWLANTLFYLRIPPSGSLEKDILVLSDAIRSLVDKLGLASTLAEYNVPREDLLKVAEGSLGRADHPALPKVVQMLESLYRNWP